MPGAHVWNPHLFPHLSAFHLLNVSLFGPYSPSVVIIQSGALFKNSSAKENLRRDFPGGTVDKNPPANAGDTGSIPDPGRSHMPARQLSPRTMTSEPVL